MNNKYFVMEPCNEIGYKTFIRVGHGKLNSWVKLTDLYRLLIFTTGVYLISYLRGNIMFNVVWGISCKK